MGIIEEEKFRLEKELSKVCPGMKLQNVYADYQLTREANSEIWSHMKRNGICLFCIDETLATELGNPEDISHDHPEHENDRIKFNVMNPRVHPDSLEVYVRVNSDTVTGLLAIQLELCGYTLEFCDNEGQVGYDVFDLKIQEITGRSSILKKYVKKRVCGRAHFSNPLKVHIVNNMLMAKFGVVDFSGTDNFIHIPFVGTDNPES